MNKYLLPALVTLLMAPLAQADYATQVPLTLEGEGPWYRLELPLSLQMAARHTDLRDLRVLNAEGEELAYALTLGTSQPAEQRQEAAHLSGVGSARAGQAPDRGGQRPSGLEEACHGQVLEGRRTQAEGLAQAQAEGGGAQQHVLARPHLPRPERRA